MPTTIMDASPAFAAIYAASVYLIAWLVAALLLRRLGVSAALEPAGGRFAAIDGLRGVLALAVFAHHTQAAYGYFTTGDWRWSGNLVFDHFGQTGVALFFMITGFLFSLKAAAPEIGWVTFYRARAARLWPLYAVVVCAVFGLALARLDFSPQEPPAVLLRKFVQWLVFVCFGRPDIEGLPKTWTMIAGVNWSLKYEAIFYVFAVPVLHLCLRWLSARSALALSLPLLAGVLAWRAQVDAAADYRLWTAHFLCGIAVGQAWRWPPSRAAIGSWPMRAIAVSAFLALPVIPAYGWPAVLASALIFAAVAGGASICGLLTGRAARWLGEISYGIYLLHGLLLWLVLAALSTTGRLQGLPLSGYLLAIAGISAAVVLLASCTYLLIERPAILWARTAGRAARRAAMPAAS